MKSLITIKKSLTSFVKTFLLAKFVRKPNSSMSRTVADLQAHALKFWPEKIAEMERDVSVIPRLIETQDKFISLIKVADFEPFAWKTVLSATNGLPANLFLKHLIVLSDMGGEKLMRYKNELSTMFPSGEMEFALNGNTHSYKFKTFDNSRPWTNKYLGVDGVGLTQPWSLEPIIEDAANLILFGGSSTAEDLPSDIEDRCIIGTLIGKGEELETFVKQRYIWVSRITGGATANSLGNLSQGYVMNYLIEKLPLWNFSKKHIPGVSHNDRTPMKFDIVAESPSRKYCGIEASFQVTTNSTIERKAGQAQSRQAVVHKAGHKIAYVIDGAGNFHRQSALRTICDFSDCTISYKDEELDKLVAFLTELENL